MIDWSSTFDIVFAAVTLALALFFLLSATIVAVKGKRACNAFDVVLRILAALALTASAVMIVCAVFTMLNGDYRIYAGPLVSDSAAEHELIAKLYLGGKVIDLPFPLLFCFLSTTVGSNIIAILFICSLVALIVDCLVANKKSDKKSGKKQPQKSPEQLKREAELERIRRLGEQAVRKTNEAARASSQDEKNDAPTATEPEQHTEAEQEPISDWRTSPQPEQQTGFVGIKDEADDFDTFDDFDADTDAAEQPEQAEYSEQPDEFAETEQTDTDEFADGDEFEGDPLQTEETDETEAYDTEEGEQPLYDEQQDFDEEQQYVEDEQPLFDEQQDVDEEQPIETEENVGSAYEPVYDGSEADNYLYEQPTEQIDEQPTEQIDEQPTEESFDGFETDEQSTEESFDGFETDEQSTEQVEEQPLIEPDRDIYIPEMRTIVKQEQPEQPPQERAAVKKPRANRSASPKPRTARPATRRTVEQTSDDKRLPVTRRYVILDRRNAVNMFGEYLKERNQAEKDKLKSSINTIIIE